MSNLVLRIRRRSTDPWIQNHHAGGWKVRSSDKSAWIPMTTFNTVIMNPDFNPNLLADPISNPMWLSLKV